MNVDLSVASHSILAIVAGKPLITTPADLFIPPDALEILLDSFCGPLDLLLYLIRRQNIDILNIPIAHITQQYMQYIHLMEEHRLELAADYLVMAAMLAEIKSRLLLPTPINQEEEIEEDPRLMLVRKLQIYEKFKNAALQLDNLPRCERDIFRFSVYSEQPDRVIIYPDLALFVLTTAMQDLMKQQDHLSHHQIVRESLSVRERMSQVLERLQQEGMLPFTHLFNQREGRKGLAVTLLAILELARQSLLLISQASAYAPMYLQAVYHE